VEEFLVVGVLHLTHPAELFHPSLNFQILFSHGEIMPVLGPPDNLATSPQPDFGRGY
jgi:hypothetical protein